MLGFSSQAMAGGTVYFKNTLGWSKVYVSFFTQGVWKDQDKNVVPNNKAGENGEMTLVDGTTDVYSFSYNTSYATICFMSHDMHNWGDFNGYAACYRGDFNASMPMFTPNTTKYPADATKCSYYNNGSWTTYAPPAPDPCPNCKTITKQ